MNISYIASSYCLRPVQHQRHQTQFAHNPVEKEDTFDPNAGLSEEDLQILRDLGITDRQCNPANRPEEVGKSEEADKTDATVEKLRRQFNQHKKKGPFNQ